MTLGLLLISLASTASAAPAASKVVKENLSGAAPLQHTRLNLGGAGVAGWTDYDALNTSQPLGSVMTTTPPTAVQLVAVPGAVPAAI